MSDGSLPLNGASGAGDETLARGKKRFDEHSARAVAEKYTAVGRLYWGLIVLVFMTAGRLALVVVRMLLGSPTA